MINHKHKFIFVRIAKCASTAMMVNLFCDDFAINTLNCGLNSDSIYTESDEYSDDYTQIVQTLENVYRENLAEGWSHDPNHISLAHIKEKIPTNIFNNYFKFGFVRNPFDRLVSAYNYSKTWYDRFRPDGLTKKHKTFKEFVKTENINGKYGLQSDWVKGCDFVGKYETLTDDYRFVCSKLNINTGKLICTNKSTKFNPNYNQYYDSETKKIVEEKYAYDLQISNYKFNG